MMLPHVPVSAGMGTEGKSAVLLLLAHRSEVILLAAAAALAGSSAGSVAHAQGRVDVRYEASLAGLPIGRGSWVIDIGSDKYLAAGSGVTAGITWLFSSGEGTGASRGSVVKGQLVPASYTASITSSRGTREVRIALSAGDVKDVAISPPVEPDPERVPLNEAHRAASPIR